MREGGKFFLNCFFFNRIRMQVFTFSRFKKIVILCADSYYKNAGMIYIYLNEITVAFVRPQK